MPTLKQLLTPSGRATRSLLSQGKSTRADAVEVDWSGPVDQLGYTGTLTQATLQKLQSEGVATKNLNKLVSTLDAQQAPVLFAHLTAIANQASHVAAGINAFTALPPAQALNGINDLKETGQLLEPQHVDSWTKAYLDCPPERRAGTATNTRKVLWASFKDVDGGHAAKIFTQLAKLQPAEQAELVQEALLHGVDAATVVINRRTDRFEGTRSDVQATFDRLHEQLTVAVNRTELIARLLRNKQPVDAFLD
jgi:hypothetical protein